MSRLEQKQESFVTHDTLQSEQTRHVLLKFSELFRACAGPHGKNHVVRNNSGGHVTVTSSCARMLAAMSISRPELKLITTSVQAHMKMYGDAGLFMIYICSRLILLGSDLGMKYHTLKSLNEIFLDFILADINHESEGVAIEVGLDRLDLLLAYVKSILSSKSLLNLNLNVCEKLSQLVLKVFLESIPNVDTTDNYASWKSDRIYCMTVENKQFSESSVESGVILQFPEHSIVDIEALLDLKSSYLDASSSARLNVPEGSRVIKVAVVTCSMSGDAGEMTDVHFEVSASQDQEAEGLVVGHMLDLCAALEERAVALVLCQKVIHPRVKACLRSKGIMWLDRLGSQVVPYVLDLTGAVPLSTIVTWDDLGDFLGCVTSVTLRQERGQGYLHLTCEDSPVVTFRMCGPTEEKLEELKMCVKASLKGLGHVVRDRKLLVGGGCWQVKVAHALRGKVYENLKSLSQQTSCSELDVIRVATVFRMCLFGWALALKEGCTSLLTDPTCGHAWRVPAGAAEEGEDVACCCGLQVTSSHGLSQLDYVSVEELSGVQGVNGSHAMISTLTRDREVTSDTILDSYTAGTSALRQAVSAANLVLSIGQFIVDGN